MAKGYTEAGSNAALTIFLTLCIGGGLGVLGKVGLLHRMPNTLRVPVLLFLGAWIFSGLFWKLALRYRNALAPLVLLGLIACPLVVLPHAEKMHAVGRGTDQPTCIVVASDGMLHGRWPYDASRMWSHNPLSCGPGWVVLQAPLVQTLGYRWAVILELMVSSAVIVWVCGWNRAAALFSLVALAPGFWVAACDGSDFLTFGLAIVCICVVSVRSKMGHILLALVLGLITQFRTASVLTPATLAGRIGRFTSIAASVIAIGMQALFLWYDPLRFTREGPMHLFSKLTGGDFPQATPLRLAGAYILLAVLATLAMQLLARRFRYEWTLMGYLLCIFAVPAALNLFANLSQHGWSLASLGIWEGGNWIIGCLPLSALLLVRGDCQSKPWLTTSRRAQKTRAA